MAHDSEKSMDIDQKPLVVGSRRRFSKVAIGGLAGLVVGFLAAAPFLFGRGGSSGEGDTISAQDFSEPDLTQVEITPAPADLPQPPQQVQPAAMAPDDSTAQRIAELEARLRAAEDARRADEARRAEQDPLKSMNSLSDSERFNSPLIVAETVADAAQAAASGNAPASPVDKPPEGALQAKNPNEQFLAARSEMGVDSAKATQTKRIDALVPQGTMLRGVLETAINTDLPGMVRAITTEDVWSFDGRRILIPSGSRLIGEYSAEIQEGQTRAFIAWTRVLRADGVSLNLGSIGTDELGRSGMAGEVDTHFFKRFGAAMLISTLSAVPAVLEATGTVRSPRYRGPVTTTVTNPTTGLQTTTTTYPDKDDGRSSKVALGAVAAISRSMGETAQEFLKGAMAIQPTLTIDQGTPIAIFVRRDLDFSGLYPDPVMQRLRELQGYRRR